MVTLMVHFPRCMLLALFVLFIPSSFSLSISPPMPPPTNLSRFILALPPPTSTSSIVVGNAASDLDSIISALTLAFISPIPIIPLVNLPATSFHLRPDYQYLVKAFNLPPLPSLEPLLENNSPFTGTLTLVDANTFSTNLPTDPTSTTHLSAAVTAIFDHHVDQNSHLTASPRVITVPTGSTATLIYHHLYKPLLTAAMQPPPATLTATLTTLIAPLALLLVTIMVDTNDFDSTVGKATPLDESARSGIVEFLNGMPEDAMAEHLPESVAELYEGVVKAKFERAFWDGLTLEELVDMDYKAFKAGGVTVGIASLLLPMESLGREGLRLGEWRRVFEEGVDCVLFMCLTKGTEGTVGTEGGVERGLVAVWNEKGAGVEGFLKVGTVLELEVDDTVEYGIRRKLGVGEEWGVRAFRQRNRKASRKIVAPVLVEFLEGKEL